MPCRAVEWHQSPLGPQLPTGEVHLWLTRVAVAPDCAGVLSTEERLRAAKFRFEHDRQRWTAGRVLLRVVLGRYLDTAPESVVLDAEDRGRRFVRWPEHNEWLSFSPTRSGDLALVAVARDTRLGVDVERIRLDLDVVAIARRAFGDRIADRLADAPDAERVHQFFQEWVREEARGKCRGTGLVEPEDEARDVPLHVTDLGIEEGYVGAVASEGELVVVRGCVVGGCAST
jgi:4'-phosphopantetheinyl transferase